MTVSSSRSEGEPRASASAGFASDPPSKIPAVTSLLNALDELTRAPSARWRESQTESRTTLTSELRFMAMLSCGRFLLFAHFAPAGILLGLCEIGIFLPFQPEAEPIYISLLGSHSFPGLHQRVISVRHVYQVHRLCESRQSCEPFPSEE